MALPRRRRVGLIVGLVLLVPTTADASWIGRSFFELLRAADDALVVRVDSTGGPKYGQWAQVSVRRSLKGSVRRDTIRLPFSYGEWPFPARPNVRTSLSTALDRRFTAGQRLLVLVVQRPRADTTGASTGGSRRSNPFAAAARYQVYPYPSDTRFNLRRTDVPILDVAKRLVRADRAETAAAQADALRPILGHENPRVRQYAAGAARELTPDPLAPNLLSRFEQEKRRRTRRYVTKALATMDHPGITPTLLAAAPDDENALQALRQRPSGALVDPLMQMYEALPDTADEGTIVDLLRALSEHAGPEHLPTFIRWYERAEAPARWNPLLHLIGATRTEDGIDFVQQVLEEGPTPARRAKAAEVAGRHSLDALAPTLLHRFETEPSAKVRRSITGALAELNHPGITPALLDAAPTYPRALRALTQRTDSTLATSLIRLYKTVADTAGPRTTRTFRSVLARHLSSEQAPVLVRWYGQAEAPGLRRSLLHLIGPLKTPTSDSLLAAVVREEETETLRLVAAQLLGEHGTRHPDALTHALRHEDSRRVRETALRALGQAGHVSTLDAIVSYAPPPCAVTGGSGFLTSAWQTIVGWTGQDRRPKTPWLPFLFDVLRQLGQQASPTDRSPVRDAVASYLSCSRFEEVRLLAAKTLFSLGPSAGQPILRDRFQRDPSPRVRKEIRHLLWMSARIDES